MLKLIKTIEDGFPTSSKEMSAQIQEYFQHRKRLSVVDGVILYNDRVVIPSLLRKDILLALHSAHQGVTSMNSHAESSVFWPGITRDISMIRESCPDCN